MFTLEAEVVEFKQLPTWMCKHRGLAFPKLKVQPAPDSETHLKNLQDSEKRYKTESYLTHMSPWVGRQFSSFNSIWSCEFVSENHHLIMKSSEKGMGESRTFHRSLRVPELSDGHPQGCVWDLSRGRMHAMVMVSRLKFPKPHCFPKT